MVQLITTANRLFNMIRLVVAYRLRPRRRHYGGIICFRRYRVLGAYRNTPLPVRTFG
ncbi:MAG TPA: hypothetical protein PLX23_03650 [Candidatus Hydrogenedens sp.]|nr:hypothetical protein [Candidatus Hydrogenedens sp.]